jgi:hypothetical protein
MKPEALTKDEAKKAFDRFKQAVAKIAAVPKEQLVTTKKRKVTKKPPK